MAPESGKALSYLPIKKHLCQLQYVCVCVCVYLNNHETAPETGIKSSSGEGVNVTGEA